MRYYEFALSAIISMIHNFTNITNITIYHDYEGLEKWANDRWRKKSGISKYYYKQLIEFKKKISFNFIHVKAHSGNTYNETADLLAKEALKRYTSK